ncbi:carboxypeptidase-like regulatory domain-containing protein [Archangium lansingense]|uniref:Carboxypeptidase-like regulatory domain-containing protein n=1 Tax=Archangium lansingense TaxID=2995310 RepID=A0ABT4AMG5_9BACT|nr:carboxypeptidase-like regulatory domain-containing protein [Archangium lansinium]MCY1082506.1 carboxypeptidase-like regulatory domain-containing protein [Archangium lansinium]
MRRWWMRGGLLAVLALGMGLAMLRAPDAASLPAAEGASGSRGPMARMFQTLLLAEPSAGETTLHIRGTVKGAQGPVAGARVLASATVEGESLSELPCPDSPMKSISECASSAPLLELVAQRSGEAPVLARATSAADGSFSLEGLKAGRHALWVESPEGTALLLDVMAGEEGVELVLGPGVRVSGVVSGDDEKPVAGALVTAIYKAHSRFFEAVSDDTGHFTLGTLPRGEYSLVVSREGLLPLRSGFLGYPAEMNLRPQLFRARRMSGTVVHGGEPMAGVQVRTHSYWDFIERKALTDASGRFSFEGLPPQDTYGLTVVHEGLKAALDVDFKAPEGSDSKLLGERTELLVELTPAIELRGIVRDEAGRPILNAEVTVEQQEGEFFTYSTSAETDAEGRYVLDALEPGIYQLAVDAEGHLTSERQTLEVLKGTGHADFVLPRATLLEGVLVDAEGEPVPGETVNLTSPDLEEAFSTMSKEGGRFSFDLSHPGPYHLQLPGGSIQEQSRVEVTAPGDVLVRVERLPRVRGQVVDETGMPLPYVEVSIWAEAPHDSRHQLGSAQSGSDGRFSLKAPSEGRYRLAAEFFMRGIAETVIQRVEVDKRGAEVQVRLGEGGRALSGVVVDARGQPLEGVNVEVLSTLHASLLRCGMPAGGMKTGPDGRFQFQRVSGESLVLKVRKDLYALSCSEDEKQELFPLTPEAREVRVVLVKRAFVYGRLVQEDGAPVNSYTLNGSQRAQSEGRFSWLIRCTGPLTLELSAPEVVPGSVPVRRSVVVQEEVKMDLGTIVIARP